MTIKFVKDSVRLRILLATLIPVVFIFITLIPISYYYIRSGFDKEIEERLISVASLIATIPNIEYAADLKDGDEELVSFKYLVSKLKSLKEITSLKSAFIFDRDGRLLVSSEGDKIGKKIVRLEIDRLEIEKAFSNIKSSSILFKGNDGFYYKNAYVPVIFDGDNVVAVLGVSASVSYFETLNNIRNGIVAIIFGSLILIVLIITVVSKGISRPIADMINQAKRIAKGEFEKSLNTKTYGELAILVDTFETMRERIMNRDKEMQMMLSGIAHEIRNPLGGMQIMIDLLLEKYKDDSEATQLINQMNSELRYLNNVVTSFLKYSRNINIEKQKVNLTNVITEVTEILGYEFEKKEITLTKELQDVEIMSDYEILRQCFTNIILNSIQAIELKGKIDIKMKRENNFVVVSIKDNGKGIKAEDMNMLFRPFFTTKEKGSGLGLALVKKYLLHLGGDIKIESEYQKGCEVNIYLPVL